MTQRRKLVAGNWKMNGLNASLSEVIAIIEGARALPSVELAVCPPATLAGAAAAFLKGSDVALGGQDCHAEKSGAFTGDISAEMWADLGAKYVIVGHSERRAMHGETDAVVATKARAVLRAGLIPIICLGESLAERDAGQTLDVVNAQLSAFLPIYQGRQNVAPVRLVVAYEPIWAIGTGRTPTVEQVAEVHGDLRAGLWDYLDENAETVRILYGGSVKPDNARELMSVDAVDGALVGGASLKSTDFLAIARACI